MEQLFCKYFEGYFNNQIQAFTYPRDFALIELNHIKIGKNKFIIKQKYVHEEFPYRISILTVTQLGDKILLKSHKNDSDETYIKGCDVLLTYNHQIDTFHGKNICKECFINKNGLKTYLSTEVFLKNNIYTVVDRGINPKTNKQVWGSFSTINNGFYIFDRK